MAMKNTKVRSAYDDDYSSDDFGTTVEGLSCTKQSFKDECDINIIVNRWLKSGQVGSSFNANQGSFLDVSDVPDYHTAMNVVAQANQMFSALPSDIRDRFQNDPGQLLRFLEDPKNREEAVKLGICNEPVVDKSTGPQSPSGDLSTTPPAASPAENRPSDTVS